MVEELFVDTFTPTEVFAETPNALTPTLVFVDTPALMPSDFDVVRASEYPAVVVCPTDVELLILLDVPVVLEEFQPLLTVLDWELEEFVPTVSEEP